ncbi:MAG: hypothetical protein ABIO04_08390 [Ferruginibacter sp.]
MNVLILEMGGSHIECIYTFVHLLKLQEHDVHLACNKKLVPLFPEKERLSGLLTLSDKFTSISQLTAITSVCNYMRKKKIDTLVINTTEITIVRNLSFFIPNKINCTAIAHNAKKLEKSVTFTKILSKKIRKFYVLSDNLLKNIHPDPVFKLAVFYPIYFPRPKKRNIIKPASEFWVTVAGEAEHIRRDYKPLLNEIQRGNISSSIRFIFLGKYNLDNIVEAGWKETAWWKKHIVYFDRHVDYDTFHNYIMQSDILLPLIKLQNDELYTNSRISGSFNLGLGYKKPFLLPDHCNTNSDLQPYSIYYSTMKQLMDRIEEFKCSALIKEKIQQSYKEGPFNNVDKMALPVCSFIAKKS